MWPCRTRPIPGVLVLSRFAGAAEQMRQAILVNPYDIPATAQAIQRALQMSLGGAAGSGMRRLLEADHGRYDVHRWRKEFLEALVGGRGTRQLKPAPRGPGSGPPLDELRPI